MERTKEESRFPVPCIHVTIQHVRSVMSAEKQKDIYILWTTDGIRLKEKNDIGTNTVEESINSKTVHECITIIEDFSSYN